MPHAYPKPTLPSPNPDLLRSLDVVTFTSSREDPEKSRRGAEIRDGRAHVSGPDVFVIEDPPERPPGTPGCPRDPKVWSLRQVRLRTVRRGGTLIAKLPHILGDR